MSGEAGTRAWFERYLEAFNAAEFATFGAYYHPQVEFHGQAARLVGREAVLAFYRHVRARIDEHIGLLSFVGSPSLCAAEMATTLRARKAWSDFPTGPLLAGDTRASVNFVFYDIADNCFVRIRSARYRRTGQSAMNGQNRHSDDRLGKVRQEGR